MMAIYIILGVLLVIILLLCIPVKIELVYKESIWVKIQYLFIKKIIDKEQLEKEEKTVEKDVEEDVKKDNVLTKIKSIIKNCGIKEFLGIIARLLKMLTVTSYKIIKKIKIKKIDIYFCAGGQNPSETALLYGKACGIIYPFIAELANITKCKNYAVAVDCNYNAKESVVVAETVVCIVPIFVVGQGVKLLFKAFPQLRKLNV